MRGYLAIILHSHLPYVRHPEYNDFLEEDWLYEAITETYIPLLDVFERLTNDNIDFHITMSLTPTLLEMLKDELLMKRYKRHLSMLIELSEKEIKRTSGDPDINPLARMYHDRFVHYMDVFENRYKGNITSGFKRFMELGSVELVTCAATHAYLPLLIDERWQDIQVHIGIDTYTHHLGAKPVGIWLPENAYIEGLDRILNKYGIRYTFLDAHGVLNASVRPRYGVYAPICSEAGVNFFGRDMQSAKQVWSAKEGYPGDYDYREFYRDVGYDLDFEYVKPYLHSDGSRSNLGIKYYRITGKTDNKQPYVPQWAMNKVITHAGNFVFNREKHIEYLAGIMDRKPIITAMYDAELFGHWWFEGPDFLEQVFRKLHEINGPVKAITPGMYLKEYPDNQIAQPSQSSWGDKGYHEVWLNGTNDWIYRHLHIAQDRMNELMHITKTSPKQHRAINQALRELLLAQSSDWPFIMNSGTMVEYAKKRFISHISRFTKLYEQIKHNRIEHRFLEDIESKDNIFTWINYEAYR
ncbi:MAG: glycoside hydrolase family 57 protein [bacterium]